MLDLKSALGLPLRLVPAPLRAGAASVVINHLLRGQGLVDRLRSLDGKCVSVRLTDVPCTNYFRFQEGRLHAARPGAEDVAISGSLRSFFRLAAGLEDPDTLFFRRELCIEGDTATAVYIKNVLDSLEYDWDAHFDAVLPPALARRAKRIRRLLQSLPLPSGFGRGPAGPSSTR
ncbi:MAG: SCP2 sterol-binding domain-containing protein [Gammaproteobacteria bacterium]|nr:SCP2 sterol-binding domain-containing protein [Gammaproteobacteria bacterium]